jgi:hypothetical protein
MNPLLSKRVHWRQRQLMPYLKEWAIFKKWYAGVLTFLYVTLIIDIEAHL